MTAISEDIIRQRAHAIWEAQGRPHGQEQEHWEQAVRELMNGSSTPLSAAPARVAKTSAKTSRPKLSTKK